MKSGAGDDPFAEEDEAETESEASGSENVVGKTRRENETTVGERTMPEDASRADGDVDGGRVRGGETGAGSDTAAAGEATNEGETVGTADAGADTGSDDSGGGPADGAGTVADGEATERPAGGSSAGEDKSASGEGGKTSTGSNGDGGPRDIEIPWVLRRGSVKDDRPNVTQFFLRDETDTAERRFKNEVEEIIDADVYTLDLREAAYLVAMRHPEEVAEELRAWGYDYLD